MTGIKDYSTTALTNTTVGGISIAEGMLPSNINNAFRAITADIREWYNDSQWVIYGDGDSTFTIAYGSATTFTVASADVTTFYHVGRRVKAIAATPGTIYGTISATAFSTNTTVTVVWDSGSLSNEAVTIYVSVLSKTNDSIPELVITNAKVAAAAAIDATKIGGGAVSNTEFSYLDGVTSAIQTQLGTKLIASNNLSDISSASTSRTNLGLGTIATQAASSVALTGGTITGLGSPSVSSDAATKSYVDTAVAGIRTRAVCRAASTANVVIASALENGDTLDGVTLATGNRVLLKDQTSALENGIYTVVASGAASRDTEFDIISELAGQMVVIQEGTSNADKFFLCTTDSSATLDVSSITFTVVTPQNTGTITSIVAGTGLSGGNITSSGTIAIDTATTVDKTTIQTLTNKTLTSPKINEDVAVTSTATELNILDGVTSTTAELNILDALSRGSILYGNASAATSILTKGTANQVLTSDGTDISWSNPASGGTDWQSSIVTAATLNAVSGNGYWINTTSNACTITLPASAAVGDTIVFVDYARTWGTNAITIDQNSLNFQGNTSPNPEYNTDGQSVSITYSGATQGWIPTVDDDVTLETPQSYSVDFLVVAGGGAGGGNVGGDGAGGGGAGGYRTSTQTLSQSTVYTVTVGDGGTSNGTNIGTSGSDSSISGSGITTITSAGGGAGGAGQSTFNGVAGGSGGGAGYAGTGGAGNTPSTSPVQGYAGGNNNNSNGASGGGGASAVGTAGAGNSTGQPGGAGSASSITGSSVTYSGGGGGGANTDGASGGAGGAGGGGAGGNSGAVGTAGSANTGGGGGGASTGTGGAGGKGVVILSMPDANYSGTTTGSPTVATGVSGKTVLTFTGSGSYTA
jgi:hypothetical protein